MKLVKYLGLALITLIVLFFVIGFMLPSQWEAKAERSINAPANEIFALINTPKTWPTWSAWTQEKYPELQQSFSGPESGQGAKQRWHDGSMDGELTITNTQAPTKMNYDVAMNNGEFTMSCEINLAPKDAKTDTTWRCWGDVGTNPMGRIMMKMFKPMMEQDFADSLAGLERKLNP